MPVKGCPKPGEVRRLEIGRLEAGLTSPHPSAGVGVGRAQTSQLGISEKRRADREGSVPCAFGPGQLCESSGHVTVGDIPNRAISEGWQDVMINVVLMRPLGAWFPAPATVFYEDSGDIGSGTI